MGGEPNAGARQGADGINAHYGLTGERKYRTYLFGRVFDYSPIIEEYLKTNQEIICDMCQRMFGYSQLPHIQYFGMQSPVCKAGQCRVVNLSRKYEREIRAVSADLLLPGTELGILQSLHTEKEPLTASEIAAELDCSYQLNQSPGEIYMPARAKQCQYRQAVQDHAGFIGASV
jgi:hypothetical protein